jgi:broad specificity phosphatase PhoE
VSEQIILVRHGETVHNVAGIVQGWDDSDLSDRGKLQVASLGERLQRYQPDALFCSPLGRAVTTANAIRDLLGLEVQVLDDLREMNYGVWESRSFLDIRKEERETFERWISDPDAACEQGESHNAVRARLERAFAAGAGAQRPIFVSHGTAIRIAATALLELPVMTSRHFAQDNAAVNVFVRRRDHWVLKVWNHA